MIANLVTDAMTGQTIPEWVKDIAGLAVSVKTLNALKGAGVSAGGAAAGGAAAAGGLGAGLLGLSAAAGVYAVPIAIGYELRNNLQDWQVAEGMARYGHNSKGEQMSDEFLALASLVTSIYDAANDTAFAISNEE